LTGQDVYTNQTIETGPKVVTKDSLSSFLQSEQNSLTSVINMNGSVGALVTDMKGDTYNSAMMAGVYSLAQKLDWKVYNRNQVE
jgi:hypothetical protein